MTCRAAALSLLPAGLRERRERESERERERERESESERERETERERERETLCAAGGWSFSCLKPSQRACGK